MELHHNYCFSTFSPVFDDITCCYYYDDSCLCLYHSCCRNHIICIHISFDHWIHEFDNILIVLSYLSLDYIFNYCSFLDFRPGSTCYYVSFISDSLLMVKSSSKSADFDSFHYCNVFLVFVHCQTTYSLMNFMAFVPLLSTSDHIYHASILNLNQL